uniref:Uncharacterized protein n=1 Tax=Opuntia streptacantha TaxID=393608 RepID=A0A7C8ZEU4_OPUST
MVGFTEEAFIVNGRDLNVQPTIKDGGALSKDAHTKVMNVNALGGDEVQSPISSDSLDYPPGFEPYVIQNKVHSVEASTPTRVDVNTKTKASSARRRCNTRTNTVCLGRRVTRSQLKKCKEQAGRGRTVRNSDGSGSAGEDDSPLTSDSTRTTESMRKLAEESLQVGELLGLKVVAHKENAIKRITQSLKNARVSRSIHRND